MRSCDHDTRVRRVRQSLRCAKLNRYAGSLFRRTRAPAFARWKRARRYSEMRWRTFLMGSSAVGALFFLVAGGWEERGRRLAGLFLVLVGLRLLFLAVASLLAFSHRLSPGRVAPDRRACDHVMSLVFIQVYYSPSTDIF
jgi:hypothetical protein